ncbi:unnamed protein product [Rhizophagus irregularis]|nr:unnamed protein product [Rhizophagus irregularis]
MISATDENGASCSNNNETSSWKTKSTNILQIFSNEDHSARGWDDAINNTIISNTDSDILMNTKKINEGKHCQSCKLFSLTTLNPLRDITILEKPQLEPVCTPNYDSHCGSLRKFIIYTEKYH